MAYTEHQLDSDISLTPFDERILAGFISEEEDNGATVAQKGRYLVIRVPTEIVPGGTRYVMALDRNLHRLLLASSDACPGRLKTAAVSARLEPDYVEFRVRLSALRKLGVSIDVPERRVGLPLIAGNGDGLLFDLSHAAEKRRRMKKQGISLVCFACLLGLGIGIMAGAHHNYTAQDKFMVLLENLMTPSPKILDV